MKVKVITSSHLYFDLCCSPFLTDPQDLCVWQENPIRKEISRTKNLKLNSDINININLLYIVVWFSPVQLNFQFPKEGNKEMLDIGSCVVVPVCLEK